MREKHILGSKQIALILFTVSLLCEISFSGSSPLPDRRSPAWTSQRHTLDLQLKKNQFPCETANENDFREMAAPIYRGLLLLESSGVLGNQTARYFAASDRISQLNEINFDQNCWLSRQRLDQFQLPGHLMPREAAYFERDENGKRTVFLQMQEAEDLKSEFTPYLLAHEIEGLTLGRDRQYATSILMKLILDSSIETDREKSKKELNFFSRAVAELSLTSARRQSPSRMIAGGKPRGDGISIGGGGDLFELSEKYYLLRALLASQKSLHLTDTDLFLAFIKLLDYPVTHTEYGATSAAIRSGQTIETVRIFGGPGTAIVFEKGVLDDFGRTPSGRLDDAARVQFLREDFLPRLAGE